MNVSTDMPSVVSGVMRMSFATLIRILLLRDIFGKSGAAGAVTVPDNTWETGRLLAYSKARKPPGFLF